MDRKTLNEVSRKAKEGFTLIEILVVVAIIGMLGAVAVPAYMSYLADARITTTRSLIKNIEDACQMYSMKHGGKYPDSLETLTQETDDEDALLQGGIEDPWGTPIQFEKRGKKRPLITSAGPDGEFGTEDDLTNVEKKK